MDKTEAIKKQLEEIIDVADDIGSMAMVIFWNEGTSTTLTLDCSHEDLEEVRHNILMEMES